MARSLLVTTFSAWVGLSLASVSAAAPAPKSKPADPDAAAKTRQSGDDAAPTYHSHFGMAGCGLGSLIFHSDLPVFQISAVTSNLIGGNQTSSISCSHGSNCQTPDKVAVAEQKVFISANMRALEVDVAEGGGDYAYAFAQVLGCDGDDTYPEFLSVSRDHFAGIFASSDPAVVYTSYVTALRSSAKLVKGCERMIFRT